MRRQGFALIVALWFMAMMAATVLGVSLRWRTLLAQVTYIDENGRGRLAADAGVRDARAHYFTFISQADLRGVQPNATSGCRATVHLRLKGRFDEFQYEAIMRPFATRLNINRARASDIAALLSWLGADTRDARIAADRIADWIDADDLRRPYGAERQEYRAADATIAPANAPFASRDEVRGVLGIEHVPIDELIGCIETFGDGRVDPRVAAGAVLAALPGMGEEAVGELLRRRAAGLPFTNLYALATALTPAARAMLEREYEQLAARTIVSDRPLVHVTSRAILHGRVVAQEEAVLDAQVDEVRVLWRRRS